MSRALAVVHYNAREGFARGIQTVCNDLLRTRSGDPELVFWRAYGMLLEGDSSQALRDLAPLTQLPDFELAASAAMVMAHETAKVVDHEAVMELQTKLDVEESSASDAAALHLAAFYMYTASKERARGLMERVLMTQPDHHMAQTLLGWIIINQHVMADAMDVLDESELDEAMRHFEAVLDANPDNLECLMGKARLIELKKNFPSALDLLTEINIKFQWFTPALLEKIRLLVAVNDWEQANEHTQRILQADAHHIMGLAWQAMYLMIREGNNKAASSTLKELHASLSRHEPRNAELYYRLARPFARLAAGDPNILTHTGMMSERAMQLRPDHAPYVVEAGNNRMFGEEYARANEKFTLALELDELNIEANCGSLECSLYMVDPKDKEGVALMEAGNQLIFLEEMISSQNNMQFDAKKQLVGDPPVLSYLKGLLAWKQGEMQEGIDCLEKAIVGQFDAAAEFPPSFDYFTALCPCRITSIVRLMLSSLGGEPRSATEAPSPLMSKANRALELLAKAAPALLECQILQARALYLNGNLDAAQRKAADLLRNNPEEYNVHLLICSVYIYQDKPQQAMAALEQAVSANFAVRETPMYHIVNAKVLIASDKCDDARKVLESAMNLPGVRVPLNHAQRSRLARSSAEPSLHERATIYLLLVDVLCRLSKLPDVPEAKKYITDAIREFEGTSEEVRVTVADSEMAINRGDVEGALKKLRRIPDTSPHFTKARMAMAEIYLKHRKDKLSYVKCYLDLVDRAGDYDTYCMLGEAFMQIQECEKAVKAFEMALEFSPRDSELVVKIARALITTHDYQRAIDYFNKAIYMSRSNWSLQLELANLLMRLRQWQAATGTLNKCMERQRDNPNSSENITIDVESWVTMGRVYKGMLNMESYVEAMNRALELQKQLLLKLRGELPETLLTQREKTADICYNLAEHYERERKFDRAMELYNEALRHCETHKQSSLALAKLQLANGDVEVCQQQCVQLLKHDPNNEEASIMLAELMFHKENYDTAIYHFQQLLERSPNHYGALANLILLLRRAGRLEDVPKHFTAAETASPKAIMEPGYHYCNGLYQRYVNNPRESLKEFNMARKDSKWGGQAILHMVEIYLNPDNDAVWEEKENADTEEGRAALATARNLLAQMRSQDTQSQRYHVLECYAAMSTKDAGQVESALSRLLDMANQDPNNVPVLLAMATGFMIMKQTPKARNQLKRVQKIAYKPDEADEFERSWLLLADIHIQGGKFDLAQDLCKKCLKYNKSCAKAWEYMGAIMEREQSYKDAAEHYEMAWKHENQASAVVGYKLAFNYLKAKRFVEAIDVCHKVIKAFPDYPKIRTDILQKARMGLKP